MSILTRNKLISIPIMYYKMAVNLTWYEHKLISATKFREGFQYKPKSTFVPLQHQHSCTYTRKN
jgi:hypothetical protein